MAGTRKLSLKFKTMAVCLSLTVALAGLSAYGLNVLKNQQETAAYATLAARAETLANAIAARFYEHYVDIKVIAQHPTLRGTDRAAVVHAFNAIARETNTFALMLFVDPKGHLLAVNEKTPEGESLDLPSLYARDFSQYEWFRSPLSGRTSDSADRHLHGTYVEPMNDLPAMSAALGRKVRGNKFSTAVHNEAGEIIGVLAGAADHRWYHEPFTQAYKTMKDQKFPHTSLMLLDHAGRVLEHELGDDKLEEASMIDDFSRQMQQGQSGSFLEVARDGTEVMAGLHPLKSEHFADELGWAVAIQDSKSELLAQAVEMQRLFYMALGVAMLCCVAGSYVFASRLGSSLTGVEVGLATSTRAIATAAAQLSASSTELSGAAADQATAIQETAASIDEVSAMAKKSAENAAQSQETSVISRKAAEEGREAVQEMIRVIGAISESNAAITAQVEDGNRQISDIVKVIGEIGNKTKVINDIVFQTKLLSFNASVEAARAGEHGKGFAVVAEEVGNLARMSGDAAKEISAMLDSSIEKVESIVGQTQSRVEQLVVAGRARIESGSQVAATCGNSLSKILSLVQEVEGMVNEIASASNEQAQGVAEINRAMNSLDQVTQRNTTVAQSAAEGSRNLTQQAQDLTHIIAQLHLLVRGTEADANAEAMAAAAAQEHVSTSARPAAPATARATMAGGRPRAPSAHEPWRRSEQAPASAHHSGQVAAQDPADGPDFPPSRDDARFKHV